MSDKEILLRLVFIYIKSTQCMNISTRKSDFLNGCIIQVLISISISPWEPKQTDNIVTATGHCCFGSSLNKMLLKLAISGHGG